jgi:hypothetical protein
MALYDCTCKVTGGPGILDDMAGTCCCYSPLIGIFCDGTMKDLDLWKEYRGIGEPPEKPPGKNKFSDVVQSIMEEKI